MSRLPPWKVSVWRKHIQISAFEIPAHKLGSRELKRFLHALVVRSRTKTLEDMIPYYVNGRRGQPNALPFARTIPYQNDDMTELGYWCGKWECYARATQTIDAEKATIIRELLDQNLRSS